jgi:hypothetical protein
LLWLPQDEQEHVGELEAAAQDLEARLAAANEAAARQSAAYERLGREGMSLKEALTQMKQRSAEMAVKAQVRGCCCTAGRSCSEMPCVARKCGSLASPSRQPLISPHPRLTLPPSAPCLPFHALQKQAEEAAAQRAAADAQFREVSAQLEAERGRIRGLEVCRLGMVPASTVACRAKCAHGALVSVRLRKLSVERLRKVFAVHIRGAGVSLSLAV